MAFSKAHGLRRAGSRAAIRWALTESIQSRSVSRGVLVDVMQRQFLLAIVLSFLVIYGWQALFPAPKPPRPDQAPQQVTSAPSGTQAPGAQPAETPPTPVEPEAAKPLVAATAEQDVVVESKAVRAVFNTRGGTLRSWKLKDYRDGT